MSQPMENDFIDSWLLFRQSPDKPAAARSIISAAVDQPADAQEIREYLAHLGAALQDVLGPDEEEEVNPHA